MELRQLSDFPKYVQDQWEKAGFKELTEVQEKAIPLLVEGKDLIIESPTGTGKTLAYLLPILNKIDPQLKKVQAVIIAPTRELVMQIHQVAQSWLSGSEATSSAFIGGADIKRQVEKLKKHPQVVIGTPARLQELVSMKKLKMHEVRILVLDEADQLFVPDTYPIVEDLIRTTQADRQLVAVSATITGRTEELAKKVMNEPARIHVARPTGAAGTVTHQYVLIHPRDKIEQLRHYIKSQPVKGLVFINGTSYIPEVAKRLKSRGVHSGILSGEGKKTEREATMVQFRNGQFPILLTTDLAARGLDFEGITHVFHFDLPEELSQYIHRSGRTGRLGAKGTVVSFITSRDEKRLQQFAAQLNVNLEKIEGKPSNEGGRSFKRPSGAPGERGQGKAGQKPFYKEGPRTNRNTTQKKRGQ